MHSSTAGQARPQPHESSRLAALLRYEILDTPAEEEYDDLTQLAAQLCATPVALISLVDGQRQWFKSRVGLGFAETPRGLFFCAHAIEGRGIFEVTDARRDPRFAGNPLVTGAPHIRFYAGVPLTSPDGHNIGTLCVIDHIPRQLNTGQRDALIRLGRQIIRQFEQRLLARRHAEQAALQRAILNSAVSSVLVLADDGRIARVNPAAERLFGYRAAELIGQPLTQALFPPATLSARAAELSAELGEAIEPGFAVLVASRRPQQKPQKWRLRHRDGHELPVRLSVSPIHDARGALRGYLTIVYDLGYQEQLQLRLQQIAAQVPGMLFQFLWHRKKPGRFTYVSEGIRQIYGLAPEQIADTTTPIFAALHPEDRQRVFSSLRQAASTQSAWHIEHRIHHPDKGLLWLEARATPLPQADGTVLWHGLITDITERKAQQAELEKQQGMNRRLLEGLSEAVVACDAEGKLTLFNDKARHWHGLDAMPCSTELWPEHYQLYQPDAVTLLAADQVPLLRALRGEHVQDAELAIVHGNTPRYVLINADPLYTSDGQQIGAVAVMHDITERKRIELLQREFVSTVSHELRSPLTSITGSLAVICGDVMGRVPEPMRELLDIAYQNSLRLNALINDLLDMDKLSAGKMRFKLLQQPLQPLLEQALRSNLGYAERYGVRYRLTAACRAEVRTDALRLQQVLSNLLTNAAKFSPAGERIELSAEKRGAWVRISVRDKGPGIAANFRDRVFQKFAQADAADTRQQGGTGLGLAISKNLIEYMGGRIGFDSEPGQGACFWIELPSCEEPGRQP